MTQLKSDAQEFHKLIDEIPSIAKLDDRRVWWPRFLFHFTTIHNAVSILSNGELLSRSALQAENTFEDSASPDVIHQTDNRWKDYVRLYFRPRTPTLHHNEGFRPNHTQLLNAHCPMPVYFFFDCKEIISQTDVLFSLGSLSRKDTSTFSTADELRKAPFDLIYHDSSFGKEDRDMIVYHRHAEVIVPHRLSLESLRYIRCRSQAELETLRYFLPEQTLQRWRNVIAPRQKYSPFFGKWTFVEQATLTNNLISFKFNLPAESADKGPFDAVIEIKEKWTGKTHHWRDKAFYIDSPQHNISLSNLTHSDDYEVRFTLDEYPAYAGRYQRDDIPF